MIYDAGAKFDYALRAKTQPVKIPTQLLESKLDRPNDFVARTIVRGNPLSPVFGELLGRSLDIDLSHEFAPSIANRLSNAIVDVIASICDLERDAWPEAKIPGPLARAMRFARANLDDPELGPEALAAAGAMSVRTLNRLLARWARRQCGGCGRSDWKLAASRSCKARFARSRTRLLRMASVTSATSAEASSGHSGCRRKRC